MQRSLPAAAAARPHARSAKAREPTVVRVVDPEKGHSLRSSDFGGPWLAEQSLLSGIRRRPTHRPGTFMGQLEAAQDPHQIVNLPHGGDPARFKVLLHTQTSKESQDDTG